MNMIRPDITFNPETMMYRYSLGDHYIDIDKTVMDSYNMNDILTYSNYILGENNLRINYAPDTSSTTGYTAYIQQCDNKIYDETTGIKLKNILSIITEYVRIVICTHNRNYEYGSKDDIEDCLLEKEIIEIYPKDDIMYIELER